MNRLGWFFAANRIGRWVNKHGHRLIHSGKTGRYVFRIAEDDRGCLICRSIWVFIATVFPPGSFDEQSS